MKIRLTKFTLREGEREREVVMFIRGMQIYSDESANIREGGCLGDGGGDNMYVNFVVNNYKLCIIRRHPKLNVTWFCNVR